MRSDIEKFKKTFKNLANCADKADKRQGPDFEKRHKLNLKKLMSAQQGFQVH